MGSEGKQDRPQTPHQQPVMAPYLLVDEEPKELGLRFEDKGLVRTQEAQSHGRNPLLC